MRTLSLAVIALALSASVAGAHGKGSYAIGFMESDAPVGGRYMLSDKMGLDVGLGFISIDAEDTTGGRASGNKQLAIAGTQFVLRVGLPIAMKTGDKVALHVRPGLGITSTSPENDNIESDTSIDISGLLVAEWMMSNTISISGSHGLRIALDPNNLGTVGNGVTNFGVHYWLK